MRLQLTIARKLTIFILVLMLTILTLAGSSVVGLHIIDQQSEALEDDVLVATQLLGKLDAYVSKFRVAEEYRAVAPDAASRAVADQVAMQQRQAIEAIQDEYRVLQAGRAGNTDLQIFDQKWKAYLSEHDLWISADPAGNLDDPARYRSRLHSLYVAADDAVDEVIDANTQRGDTLAASVDFLVHGTIVFIIALSTGGFLVALLLLVRVRREISTPLSAITRALGALAAGDRDIVVPSRNRHDEIGTMVDAFEVFRANAFALEKAHEAARLAQEHAQALARHDPLTGLPNRRVFETEIERAVGIALEGHRLCALLMIDLDRFKPVNDQLGHPVGDLVLCEVARRLNGLVGPDDVIARLGGDEFAIIAVAPAHELGARLQHLSSSVLAAISAPMHLGHNPIEIGATIGVASCPADGADREMLLRAADLALYRAKREGRGRTCFFERDMETELQDRAAIEADLRAAIAAGDIQPHYQPLVDMQDGSIYGFEMLAGWQHPTRGVVPSEYFMDLATQLGLLSQMTWPMLRQACRDAHEWPPYMVLAISLSPAQLRDPSLAQQILTILAQEELAPARLEIEIGEAAFVSDLEPAELMLVALQSAGIRITLEDFGTGYSNLCGLTMLHFDRVKMARSLVGALGTGEKGEDVVGTVISMADNLGCRIAAEGVEAAETAKLLAALGCKFGQGGFYGTATNVTGTRRLLSEYPTHVPLNSGHG